MAIRPVEHQDFQGILDIRNFYILNTNSLFESKPQTKEDRQMWFDSFKGDTPYRLFVAEEKGKLAGFASLGKFRDGEWFSKTAEASVFCGPDFQRKGLGSKLYGKLFDKEVTKDFHSIVCAIALPNDSSIALHEKFGFEKMGIYKEYAFKNGKFVSSQIMQKLL